jgi:KDO2-lipid IV(A) lauroyltransferase
LRKRIERRLGDVFLPIILVPLRRMPWGMARATGKGLGTLLYYVLKKYRKVALQNLTLVYGKEKAPAEIKAMAKAVFLHFGQMSTEFLKLPTLDKERVDSLVEVEGEEHLKASVAEGRGTLIMTGHFGNWEMLGRWFTTHGYTLNVVARDARNRSATKMLEETRTGSGAKVLYRGNSARAILQCLKKNELVGILPDQNAADVFVPFFGLPTGTVDGPAVIHLKTQAPLVFSWCVRLPDNRFRVIFEPMHVLSSTGDRKADIETVMTLINAHLEARIREYPTQWLWLHNRWKASPGVLEGAEEAARILNMSSREYIQEMQQKRGKP